MKSADDKDGYDRVIFAAGKRYFRTCIGRRNYYLEVADTTLHIVLSGRRNCIISQDAGMCFMPEVRTRKITGHLTVTFLSATAMIHMPELGVKRANSKEGEDDFSFTGFSLDMTLL